MATILGSSIAVLDSSVVNVALPSIERDLGGGLAGQQWVVNAYLLTLGSLILLGGSLGDLFGERRVFALGRGRVRRGLAAVRGRADASTLLIAARALQGVAGALLTPELAGGDRGDVSRRASAAPAIGTWTAWGAIAGGARAAGRRRRPDVASWRWIFLINLPLVAAACG